MSISVIMIDSREPAHIQRLKFGDVPTVVTALEHGDLWMSTGAGDLICVERKTPSDLLGSIKDGRVFPQVAGMRARTPWSYVVITGALIADHSGKCLADGRITGWDWSSVQGALLTIQELGVGVVHSQGDSDYEATVLRLADRKRGNEYVMQPKHDARVMTSAEVILTSLPGIGWDRAQDLMHHFHGRAGEALAWLTWMGTFGEVAGIGRGVKSQIRKALGLTEDEELFVMTPADYEAAAKRIAEEPAPAVDKASVNQDALLANNNIVREEDGLLMWA